MSSTEEKISSYEIYRDKKVMIGLSGGINSMAVLCDLINSGVKVSELHLFYAHFKEHSPDTFRFVADGIRLARRHFACVVVTITRNSVLEYFQKQNMIPHPKSSPCSKHLKIIPMETHCFDHEIKYDLVGYVRHELKRRGNRQSKLIQSGFFDAEKHYPIGEFSDEWCFEVVDQMIGWHPKIYDIVNEQGERVFKHNNCLPCKNMSTADLEAVRKYYPEYHKQAMDLSTVLKAYWGRSEDDFYQTFGRDLGQDSTCTSCEF